MSVTSACTSVARLDSAVAAAPIVAAVGSSVAAVTVLTASYAVSTASMPERELRLRVGPDLVEVALEGREAALQLGQGP